MKKRKKIVVLVVALIILSSILQNDILTYRASVKTVQGATFPMIDPIKYQWEKSDLLDFRLYASEQVEFMLPSKFHDKTVVLKMDFTMKEFSTVNNKSLVVRIPFNQLEDDDYVMFAGDGMDYGYDREDNLLIFWANAYRAHYDMWDTANVYLEIISLSFLVTTEQTVELAFRRTSENTSMFNHLFSSIAVNKHFEVAGALFSFNTNIVLLGLQTFNSNVVTFKGSIELPFVVTNVWQDYDLYASINNGIWSNVQIRLPVDDPPLDPNDNKPPSNNNEQSPKVDAFNFFEKIESWCWWVAVGVFACVCLLILFKRKKK